MEVWLVFPSLVRGRVDERGSKSPREWGSTGMYVGPLDRTLPPRQVTAGNVIIEKSSDCVPSASLLPLGAGAPMAPEDSDGLDNYEVPSRTAVSGEAQSQLSADSAHLGLRGHAACRVPSVRRPRRTVAWKDWERC